MTKEQGKKAREKIYQDAFDAEYEVAASSVAIWPADYIRRQSCHKEPLKHRPHRHHDFYHGSHYHTLSFGVSYAMRIR